jgi:HEAT repeat protein
MSLFRRILGPPDVQKHLERRDVAALMEDLRDQDAGVRVNAAGALGKIGDSQAAPALIKAFDDQEKTVTDAATAALSAMGPQVIPLLAPLVAEGHTWTRADRGARSAIGAISACDFENAVPKLRDLLRNPEWRVRLVAREALIAQGAATLPHAIAALQDSNPEARKAAAEILGSLRREEAVDALVPLLRDQDATVREAAATALGNIHNNQCGDALIELIRDRADPPRTAAIDAVGKLKVTQAVHPLVEAMDGADDRLMSHIAEALRQIPSDEAAIPLRSALEKTTNPDARELILSALASLRDPSMKPLLLDELRREEKQLISRRQLTGPDFKLARSVIGSLAFIGGDDVVEELKARLQSPLSYEFGDRDESQRFYPIRDAARSALELLGHADATEDSLPASETKTGRFQIGS